MPSFPVYLSRDSDTLPQTYLNIIPVLTSFLPLCHAEEYLPAVFAIWEAFNSRLVDQRFVELVGCLAEEYVQGSKDGDSTQWKDVGMFTKDQWTFLMGKLMSTLGKWTLPSERKYRITHMISDEWMAGPKVCDTMSTDQGD